MDLINQLVKQQLGRMGDFDCRAEPEDDCAAVTIRIINKANNQVIGSIFVDKRTELAQNREEIITSGVKEALHAAMREPALRMKV